MKRRGKKNKNFESERNRDRDSDRDTDSDRETGEEIVIEEHGQRPITGPVSVARH